MAKYAELNGNEVELIGVLGGWTTYIAADGSTRKDRNSKFKNHREDTPAAKAVAEALNEAAPLAKSDLVEVSDKNHPHDSFNADLAMFECGECDEAFLSGDALEAHKTEVHGTAVMPRPGSIAAMVLQKEGASKALEVMQQSAKKQAKKAEKVNPFTFTKCPECGSEELYAGRVKNPDGDSMGIVVDEDKIIGCHHCDWCHDETKQGKVKAKLAHYVVGKAVTASGRPTVDIDDMVADKLRGLSLDQIYTLIAQVCEDNDITTLGTGARKMETGRADFLARYSHLNLGMQRMNLGNVLRGIVSKKNLVKL